MIMQDTLYHFVIPKSLTSETAIVVLRRHIDIVRRIITKTIIHKTTTKNIVKNAKNTSVVNGNNNENFDNK